MVGNLLTHPSMQHSSPPPPAASVRAHFGHPTRWLPWLFGAALVIVLIAFALHFSEAREIARITESARPRWLLVALLLQVLTYVAQGEIWRVVASMAEYPLSRAEAFRLGVAKLFVDQALPVAGLSGTAAVAKYFADHGMLRSAVMAGTVLNITSYFLTYILTLLIALALTPLPKSVLVTAIVFAAGSAVLIAMLLFLPGQRQQAAVKRAVLPKFARGLLALIAEADPAMVRRLGPFLGVCLLQLLITALDAATVWVSIQALGWHTSVLGVFGSFMISQLASTVGLLPGGLGAFEVSSVLTLGLNAVPLPVALSATLLFRGASFWLPMIPGAWYARRLFTSKPRPSNAVSL
jgi:uncharacterized protein (TIRG00374 family)